MDALRSAEGGAKLFESILVTDGAHVAEKRCSLWGKAGGDECFPCGYLFVVTIEAHDANDEAHDLEKRARPLGMIHEGFRLLVWINPRVGAVGRVLRSIKFI